MNPQVVIIGEAESAHINYCDGYNTITQNSAGDIVFNCSDSKVHIYVSNYSYEVSFLVNEKVYDKKLGHYIGSFEPKGG